MYYHVFFYNHMGNLKNVYILVLAYRPFLFHLLHEPVVMYCNCQMWDEQNSELSWIRWENLSSLGHSAFYKSKRRVRKDPITTNNENNCCSYSVTDADSGLDLTEIIEHCVEVHLSSVFENLEQITWIQKGERASDLAFVDAQKRGIRCVMPGLISPE